MVGKSVRLIRTSDSEPGFHRKRCGRGFIYLEPEGGRLGDGDHLSRIRSLAIPPAYQSVWICIPPNGHLQATGLDQRERKQYRYHPEWTNERNRMKFSHLLDFARQLPHIRRQIDREISRKDLDRRQVASLALAIIDRTGARVGNSAYRDENGSHGITTLANDHAAIHGRHLELNFRGKHGKMVELDLRAPKLAKLLLSCRELPGDHLFEFIDTDGQPQAINSTDVNGLIHEWSDERFSAKTFRTWKGTLLAFQRLIRLTPGESDQMRKRQEASAVRNASEGLFNTVATCRKYYVHPDILQCWLDGHFSQTLASCRRSRAFSSLASRDERLLARFLKEVA